MPPWFIPAWSIIHQADPFELELFLPIFKELGGLQECSIFHYYFEGVFGVLFKLYTNKNWHFFRYINNINILLVAYNMLTRVIKRFASNLKTFDKLEELNKYLAARQAPQTVVYFRAAWNPQCEQADQDILKFATANPGIDFIKVDSDAAPKIAKHYSVRAEPEFVFCLYGDQVLRQIGLDYNGLERKNQKMNNLSKEVDMSGLPNKWVEYGTGFKYYYEKWVRQAYKAQISHF